AGQRRDDRTDRAVLRGGEAHGAPRLREAVAVQLHALGVAVLVGTGHVGDLGPRGDLQRRGHRAGRGGDRQLAGRLLDDGLGGREGLVVLGRGGVGHLVLLGCFGGALGSGLRRLAAVALVLGRGGGGG